MTDDFSLKPINGQSDRLATQQNILVVDDSPANLHLLLEMLSRVGYRVRPVPSGEQALAAVELLRPDLILLDVSMRGMDGYEVAQRLKRDPATATIPIIFISAHDDVEAKLKAFDVGGTDYVVKPFHEAEVLARVRTQLQVIQLQEELLEKSLEAERGGLLATFINKASHEFRTPLSIILNNADLLRRTADRPERHPKYIDRIEAAGQEIGELINKMLFIMGLSDGRSLQKEDVLIPLFIRALIESLHDPRISFEAVDLEEEHVAADVILLTLAMRELLQNAQDHTAETGQIAMTAKQDGDHTVICIQDNGEGISKEDLPHIFELFYRADGAHSTRGFGLGLPIAKQIFELHEGVLEIQSSAGLGTKAIMRLPNG